MMEFFTLGKHTYFANEPSNAWSVPVVIGAFTSIARDFTVIGGTHPSVINKKVVSNFPFKELWKADYEPCLNAKMGRRIDIGNDVWIGTNVTIIDGSKIGDGAIIGAKAVIAGEIPPYAVAVGNPIKIVRYRYTEEQIKKLLKIKWWDWKDDIILKHMPLFIDIDKFIATFYEE